MRPSAYWPLDAIDASDDGKREQMIEIDAAFGEVGALLMPASVVGFSGILLREPLFVCFIAVGLLPGQFLSPICPPPGRTPATV